MAMVQRKFYFPEEMYNRLKLQAKRERKRVTDVLREMVQEGLQRKEKAKKTKKEHPLLQLMKIADKYPMEGPTDLAENHNKYFAEAWEKLKGRKVKNP